MVNATKQPIMTAAPAFKVDALVFDEPKRGGLRKCLNRHIFGFYTPQPGDDDMLISMRLFNATLHVLRQEPPQVKNMKKPC